MSNVAKLNSLSTHIRIHIPIPMPIRMSIEIYSLALCTCDNLVRCVKLVGNNYYRRPPQRGLVNPFRGIERQRTDSHLGCYNDD